MLQALSSAFEILRSGGWAMIPLMLCSIIAVTIIIERLLFGPTRTRVLPRDYEVEALTLARIKKVEELYNLSRNKDLPSARIICSALAGGAIEREDLESAAALQGRRELESFQRFIPALGSIAAVSPLLGLLGTVFGMIHTFAVISEAGSGNPKLMAGGISEALVSTATGLAVAIPSVIFFRMFNARTKAVTAELEIFADEVIRQLVSSERNLKEVNSR